MRRGDQTFSVDLRRVGPALVVLLLMVVLAACSGETVNKDLPAQLANRRRWPTCPALDATMTRPSSPVRPHPGESHSMETVKRLCEAPVPVAQGATRAEPSPR